MAIKFGNSKGAAIKNKVDAFEFKDGENVVRLVGGVLARYVYWVKGKNNKDIPIECLSFDRDAEKFLNKEVDHVPNFYPDKKCQWSYAMNCIDPRDGKVKVINLKKKLFEQIISASETLGDPTDPDTGWSVVFTRKKTGPLAFNIEYSLSPFKCKAKALTEEEKALVASSPTIDEKYPRPTADEILALLEKLANDSDDETSGEEGDASTREAVNELN